MNPLLFGRRRFLKYGQMHVCMNAFKIVRYRYSSFFTSHECSVYESYSVRGVVPVLMTQSENRRLIDV